MAVMSKLLINSDKPVVFLGAGELRPEILAEALTYARQIFAADGGAIAALAAGHVPELVIGDLDSIDPATRAALPADRLLEVTEQETTDFQKLAARVRAPVALAVGFTGGRLDHTLAVMNALVAETGRGVVVIGTEDICFHVPDRLTLDLPAGTRVSLFPMRRVEGRQRGLRWPLDGLVFDPAGRIGTSNEALGGPVELEFSGPGMLVILPRAQLAHAVAALGG